MFNRELPADGSLSPDYSKGIISAKHEREFPGHRVCPGYVSFSQSGKIAT